jgi:polyvinyl alcohol dehydrogenase (cytochrome)
MWLEMMSPQAVVKALNEGVMQPQAATLSTADRIHIAEYLTQRRASSVGVIARAPACADGQRFASGKPPVRAGWGHDTARFVSAADAGFDAAAIPALRLRWAFAYPGALRTRSQPAIGFGAVFTGSQDGHVYSFDLDGGCERWVYEAGAEVRTAVVLVESASRPLAVFGDLLARLHAVDARTGERVWVRRMDDHPSATLTGTPALFEGRLYVPVSSLEVTPAADPAYPCCSFRGKVVAVEAATGEEIWTHFTIPDPPQESGKTAVGTPVLAPSGAPVWSSPAVDVKHRLIYFGTGENYSTPADNNSDAIMAVNLDTGERVWQRQSTRGDAWNVACMMRDNPNCPPENGPDFDHGASMILKTVAGRRVLLAGHKNGTVFGLDPDEQGAERWSVKTGRGSIQGGVHFGMAASADTLYVPINDMNDTHNGDVLDPAAARPGVHAVDIATGKVRWSQVRTSEEHNKVCPGTGDQSAVFCDPGVSAAITAMPGAVFAGHLDGYVRAYSESDGRVLWEFNTRRSVKSINGLEAKGGGMSGGGPAIGDGYVVVNSGYGLYFHMPGNALLVFAPAE